MPDFIELRHGRTAYNVCGEGPPILLLHGAEGSKASFDGLAARLRGTMTVIAHDQRGCGDTPSGEVPPTLLDLADDAAELMQRLGLGPVTVFGTSLGGRIAQALVLRHPQAVEALVLCNTWPIDALLEVINTPGVMRLVQLRGALPETGRELAGMYFGSAYLQANPEVVARFSRPRAMGPRAALAREKHELALERIDVPTLLLSGTADPIAPSEIARTMHRRIRNSTLVTVQGAPHAMPVESPYLVSEEITGFLRSKVPALAVGP
jgi:pimeloyl-ACP methyl ester carboxylesterase